MQAFIEFLPVLFGLVIANLFRFMKPLFLKNISMMTLPVISGIAVNSLSGEGIELVPVDIALAVVSTFIFIYLHRYVTILLRHK